MAEVSVKSVSQTHSYQSGSKNNPKTNTGTVTGQIYVDYSITNSDTSATITASVKGRATATGSGISGYSVGAGVNTSGTIGNNLTATGTWTLNGDASATLRAADASSTITFSLSSKTATITKTHSAQSIPVYINLHAYLNYTYTTSYLESQYYSTTAVQTKTSLTASATTVYISVPAKTSYTIQFNANGGSGAPGNQTKWYGETLTLSSTKPTRTGYNFKGWSTSSTATSATYSAGGSYTANSAATLYAVWELITYTVSYNANSGSNAPSSQTKTYGVTLTLTTNTPTKTGYTFKGWATSTTIAAAGTVEYVSGGSYTDNAAITLYAVWELTLQKPVLTNLSVQRCDQNGNADDEGTYALVSFSWSVFHPDTPQYYGGTGTGPYASNEAASCSVTVGSYTVTPTVSGASGTTTCIVGNGLYDADTQYDATASITDSQTLYTPNTGTATGILPMVFFPMDYNATATAVGFFMPAPNNGNGAYFAKDIIGRGDILLQIDTNAGSGTIDYNLNAAIVALDWDDDVYV